MSRPTGSIPAELLEDPDKARAWFERTGVSAVIVMRVLSVDKEKVASAVVWSTMHYQDFNNYYATGWGNAIPIRTRDVTTIAVETLLFEVASGKLIGAVSPNRPIQRTCRTISPAWPMKSASSSSAKAS